MPAPAVATRTSGTTRTSPPESPAAAMQPLALHRRPRDSASSASLRSRVITVGWVGDTTPGSMYGMPPDGGRALFGSLRPLLSKPDLMIANLEGTYSTAGPSKCGASTTNCYAFQAPPSYAAALAWSGIDLVNMANNHSMDYLARGFAQTQAALRASPTTGHPVRGVGRMTAIDPPAACRAVGPATPEVRALLAEGRRHGFLTSDSSPAGASRSYRPPVCSSDPSSDGICARWGPCRSRRSAPTWRVSGARWRSLRGAERSPSSPREGSTAKRSRAARPT